MDDEPATRPWGWVHRHRVAVRVSIPDHPSNREWATMRNNKRAKFIAWAEIYRDWAHKP